jgi:hypothetical protein
MPIVACEVRTRKLRLHNRGCHTTAEQKQAANGQTIDDNVSLYCTELIEG